MLYQAPDLDRDDLAVLRLIQDQRDRLTLFTQDNPKRWFGSLRRGALARAIQGSNSIEGYHATMDEVIAAIENEPTLDQGTETALATKGYRDAMTYILQAARDPYFEFGRQFLKSLHFMMIGHDMSKDPGHWRPGAIYVVNEKTGLAVYEAPDAGLVDSLIEELITYLKLPLDQQREHAIVRAAMAHLNLTMIHPFRDGNGRMARALQTLVLGREGLLHPVFSSIEEWLGANAEEYYAVLTATGQGRWLPARSALAWVRFCLKAHYQQAQTLLRRNEEYGLLYDEIAKLVSREKLPDRMVIPIFNSALGYKVTNTRYCAEADVSTFVASRDLKRICEAGLLESLGEKRGRSYRRSQTVAAARERTRIRRPIEDPYEMVAGKKNTAMSIPSEDRGALSSPSPPLRGERD